MRILIADDEKLIVDDLTRDVLEIYPHAAVDGAVNSDEVLAFAEENDYDIALLDIDMPGMDGLNMARRIVADCPSVNIIFITGYQEYALEAHELYCSAFLLKPVGVRKLRESFAHLRKPFVDIPQEIYAQHYSGGDIIGRKLKVYREQRGISRQEIADLMGVTRQTVYRWERGERIPDILTFTRLARILGIDIRDILELPE